MSDPRRRSISRQKVAKAALAIALCAGFACGYSRPADVAGTCLLDLDCGLGEATHCADDGVCVACRNDQDCDGATPTCDAEARRCRGCQADAECASGICLELEGVCAAADEALFVNANDGVDAGTCDEATPCLTLAYAFGRATETRFVVRAGRGQLVLSATLDPGAKKIYLDAIDATVTLAAGDLPIFAVASSGRLTLEGVSFNTTDRISISQGGSVRLHRVTVPPGAAAGVFAQLSGGQLYVSRSSMYRSIQCSNRGGITVLGSQLGSPNVNGEAIVTSGCDVLLSSDRIASLNTALSLSTSGKVLIENNVFTTANAAADLIDVRSADSGSRFQFNTIVNLSGSVFEGTAIFCDSSIDVGNNIIAYGSTTPHLGGCSTHHTLYDSPATFVTGEGNLVADVSTFFVDQGAQDYRPSATSPARGLASTTAQATSDFNGDPRPLPLGSRADVGAFEVP